MTTSEFTPWIAFLKCGPIAWLRSFMVLDLTQTERSCSNDGAVAEAYDIANLVDFELHFGYEDPE